MSHWNYRVVEMGEADDIYLEIRAVYYNEDGSYFAISSEKSSPFGCDVEELRKDLEYMILAMSKPILKEKEMEFVSYDSAEEPTGKSYSSAKDLLEDLEK